MRSPDVRQLPLFLERVEVRWVSDTPFDCRDGAWGSAVSRPEGRGWRVLPLKHQRERYTGWQRRYPVVAKPHKASRGGGGWRHG